MLITTGENPQYNVIDQFGGMVGADRYQPEAYRLDINKYVYSGQMTQVTRSWVETAFGDNYLEGQKANLKNLPALTIWQQSYQRVGFATKKIEVIVPTIAVEAQINERYYALGTIAQRQQTMMLEEFRNTTYDQFGTMLDYALYRGATFSSDDLTASYGSYRSGSTDPASIGLPTTVAGGASTDFMHLIEEAIGYLSGSGTKRTTENQMYFIIGSKILRQSLAVINGTNYVGGTPTVKQFFTDKYGLKLFASEALANDMIVCDRTMVENIFAQGYLLDLASKTYKHEHDKWLAMSGLACAIIKDKRKSLYYSDVIQPAVAKSATAKTVAKR